MESFLKDNSQGSRHHHYSCERTWEEKFKESVAYAQADSPVEVSEYTKKDSKNSDLEDFGWDKLLVLRFHSERFWGRKLTEVFCGSLSIANLIACLRSGILPPTKPYPPNKALPPNSDSPYKTYGGQLHLKNHKHLENCLIVFAIREMQINTTLLILLTCQNV